MAKLQTLKPRLATAGPRLAVMQPGSWRTDKQSSTQRGYTYKWQQARAGYLSSHPFCVFCLREQGITTTETDEQLAQLATKGIGRLPFASVVDHIEPHRGDMTRFWNKTNWQSLCTTHHSADKQREEQGVFRNS
jgi:5-methylcytosine-specific restriction protein A